MLSEFVKRFELNELADDLMPRSERNRARLSEQYTVQYFCAHFTRRGKYLEDVRQESSQ